MAIAESLDTSVRAAQTVASQDWLKIFREVKRDRITLPPYKAKVAIVSSLAACWREPHRASIVPNIQEQIAILKEVDSGIA